MKSICGGAGSRRLKADGSIHMKHGTGGDGRSNVKNLPRRAIDKTVRALELPPGIQAGMAQIELSGNREAVIVGCRGVLEYGENLVRLRAGSLTLRLTGRGLVLRNFKRDSVIIEGFITSIEFAD